jgi:hypothetical protein
MNKLAQNGRTISRAGKPKVMLGPVPVNSDVNFVTESPWGSKHVNWKDIAWGM